MRCCARWKRRSIPANAITAGPPTWSSSSAISSGCSDGGEAAEHSSNPRFGGTRRRTLAGRANAGARRLQTSGAGPAKVSRSVARLQQSASTRRCAQLAVRLPYSRSSSSAYADDPVITERPVWGRVALNLPRWRLLRAPHEAGHDNREVGDYCFQTLKASAKTRSPGVPFSIARMALRLLL